LANTIIEQTDSGENNFVLQTVAAQLALIRSEIAGIRALIQAQKEASEQLQQQAEEVLEAHRQAAQNYMGQIENEQLPDWHPFVGLPQSTLIKELTDGNRLFILPDGLMLRTTDKHTLIVIDSMGNREVQPGPEKNVEVQPGRVYELVDDWVEVTHEAAGIEGLPSQKAAVQIADKRYSATMSEGTKLIVDQKARSATIVDAGGEIDYIGQDRFDALGGEVLVRPHQNGAKGFSFSKTGHGGLVDSDGSINLTLKSGEDLIIRFTQDGTPSIPDDATVDNDGECILLCQERQ
jgi:hypothetical protein